MAMAMPTLRQYLVDHPTIRDFEWAPPHTLGSTPRFVLLSVLSYLLLTLLLRRLRLPPLPHALLKPISALHSLALSLLSLAMALGCALSLLSLTADTTPSLPSALFCLPRGTRPEGPLFFWAHVFYLSKLLEFGDTALIVLGGSTRRLTFLHVYHHATVLVMCYLWLAASQSLFPVALITNATVHVVMYAYYFLSALGIRPAWKRLVTDCQIVQFAFSFAVSGRMLYIHFSAGSGGCSGIWAWCFNAVFNASLLALFLDFHSKSYKGKIEENRHRQDSNNKVKSS